MDIGPWTDTLGSWVLGPGTEPAAIGRPGGFMSGGVSTLKGIFVFSATIIGAGILALPIAGAVAGLLPTILILLLIGAVSVFSAL